MNQIYSDLLTILDAAKAEELPNITPANIEYIKGVVTGAQRAINEGSATQ